MMEMEPQRNARVSFLLSHATPATWLHLFKFAVVAQLRERQPSGLEVGGANPSDGSNVSQCIAHSCRTGWSGPVFCGVAQLVEHRTVNATVTGSIPVPTANFPGASGERGAERSWAEQSSENSPYIGIAQKDDRETASAPHAHPCLSPTLASLCAPLNDAWASTYKGLAMPRMESR
jgi:hypothetical protein